MSNITTKNVFNFITPQKLKSQNEEKSLKIEITDSKNFSFRKLPITNIISEKILSKTLKQCCHCKCHKTLLKITKTENFSLNITNYIIIPTNETKSEEEAELTEKTKTSIKIKRANVETLEDSKKTKMLKISKNYSKLANNETLEDIIKRQNEADPDLRRKRKFDELPQMESVENILKEQREVRFKSMFDMNRRSVGQSINGLFVIRSDENNPNSVNSLNNVNK